MGNTHRGNSALHGLCMSLCVSTYRPHRHLFMGIHIMAAIFPHLATEWSGHSQRMEAIGPQCWAPSAQAAHSHSWPLRQHSLPSHRSPRQACPPCTQARVTVGRQGPVARNHVGCLDQHSQATASHVHTPKWCAKSVGGGCWEVLCWEHASEL